MDLSRQSSIVRNGVPPTLLIGAGATGFHVAHALIGAGCEKLEIWDPDVVEESNLNRQLYGRENIGEYKTEALKVLLERIRPGGGHQEITVVNKEMDAFGVEWTQLNPFPIIINSADNLFFHGQMHKKLCKLSAIAGMRWFYISPRMSSFDMEIQTFLPPDDNPWEMFQTKEERMALQLEMSGCTSGGVSYSPAVVTTSMVLAGFVVQEVFNHINREPTHFWFRMDIETGKIEMNERRD